MIINNLSNAPIVVPQVHTGTVATGINPSLSQFTSEFTSQATGGTLAIPLDTPKYILTLAISQYVRTNLNSIGQFVSAGYPGIVMPLPQQLIDANVVNWQELEIGTVAGLLGNAASPLIAQLQQQIAQGQLNIAALGQALQQLGIPGIGQIGASALSAFAGAGETQALQALLGISPNQFVTMLLRGPTYKRHRFTWELSPTNFQEADVLRQIITTWKNAMAPSLTTGAAIWAFPKIFHIRLYPNSSFLYKFRPCICDSFVVNYMPAGRGSFYYNPTGTDGANPPEGVHIEAHFIELEFWKSGDFGPNTGYDNDPDHINGPSGGGGNPGSTTTNELSQLRGNS